MPAFLAQTNLPNLHPALVHFPIVLWLLAVGVEAAALIQRNSDRDRGRMICGLYVLAVASAAVTWWSGRQAASSIGMVDAETEVMIAQHSDTALQTLWILGVSAAGRVAVEVLRAQIETSMRLVLRLLILVPALIGVWLVGLTADRGGGLVYGRGVAVQRVIEAQPTQSENSGDGSVEGSAQATWAAHDDGSRELESVVDLEVHGTDSLLIDDALGDVLMIADLDLTGFEGELSLVHHLVDASNFEEYRVSSNEVSLVWTHSGKEDVLDQASHGWPATTTRLGVSVAGKHLKGYVDGSTLVHGHRPANQTVGRAGLVLRGEGHVVVRQLKVRPMSSESSGG